MSQTQVFSIFLPNKSRYRLEISKSTSLYQGLEQVCTEKGFLPVQNYVFRYNKGFPDLGTPVGMLNLSNLAELELVPASEASVGKSSPTTEVANIGLQFGSQRFVDTYSCNASLWDVISDFDKKHPGWLPEKAAESPQSDSHPVLVLMRQEVPGEAALRGTSLRQLGIRPGSAATLRLLYRSVPPERLAAATEAVAARQRAAAAATATAEESTTKSAAATATAEESTTKSAAILPAQQQQQSLPTPAKRSTTSDASAAVSAAAAAAAAPPQTTDSSSSSSVGRGSEANLFSPFRDARRVAEEEAAAAEEAARRRRAAAAARQPRTLAEALNLPTFDSGADADAASASDTAAAAAAEPPAFGPDRPFKFPEETAGQDLYCNELADCRSDEFEPCDRRLCGYLAGVSGTVAGSGAADSAELEEPDDSFFNVTESDLRKMMADLKRKAESEANAPLLTRQQREQRREDFYSSYEHSVIRLFFPDRRVVQATFRPRETVFALYKFVRDELLADGNKADFVLYTTPPRREIIDMAQFLIHADLVPMPIVYVAFRAPPLEGQAILRPDIVNLLSTREHCDRIALACMKSAVEPLYSKQQQQRQQQQQRSSAASAAASSSGSAASGRAAATVPKWFKK